MSPPNQNIDQNKYTIGLFRDRGRIMPSVRDRIVLFEAKAKKKKKNEDPVEENGKELQKRKYAAACAAPRGPSVNTPRSTVLWFNTYLPPCLATAGGQRFLFPGSSKTIKQDEGSSHALEQWARPLSGSSKGPSAFEADLEEVWSVRKNICAGISAAQGGRGLGRGGGMVSGLNGGKTSQFGLYSRQNPMSMATQPAGQGRAIGASRSTSECRCRGRVLM